MLRHTLRQLRRNPGFTITATLALALGIGANAAMFSVVDGVLLRPLSYDKPEQLVNLRSSMNRGNLKEAPLSRGDFFDYVAQNQVFSAMAGFGPGNVGLTSPTADPERLAAAVITTRFFEVLHTKPALGRDFADDEFQPGRDGLVILSDGLWRDRFGADPRILGQSITLDGRPRQVIGVMPSGFGFPGSATRLWLPSALAGEERVRRDLLSVLAIARLKDGVTVETARAHMTTLARQLEKAHPEFNAEKGIIVQPTLEAAVGQLRPAFFVLLGAVGLVLLIACANVANLLLARGAARQTEFSIRAALGAGRGTLIRQLLGESLVLATAGGAAGLAVAYALFRWLTWLAPANLPRLDQIALNGRALFFIALVTLLTGFLFGLAPALRLSRVDLHATIKQRGSRGTLRGALVVAQIAAALVLLIGAGLLMRTFVHLQDVDLGFNPENLLTLRVNPLGRKYGPNRELQVQFAHQLQEGLRTLPGVKSAGIATDLPLLGGPQFIMRFEGRPPVTVATAPIAAFATVTPDFFSTMGIKLVKGRFFAPTDIAGRPMVTIVNQSLARKYFPHEDPIGKRLEVGFSTPPNWREIVGVVGDMKNADVDKPVNVQVYGAYDQQPGVFPGIAPALSITVRTQGDPALLANPARDKIFSIDKGQPVYAIQTYATVVATSVAQKRFALLLMALFAAIALVLAAIGLTGVMSYLVAQRTREIGIRMAVGAEPRQVLWMVEKQALALALTGVAIGLAGAFWFSRSLETMLFGVSPRDPLTFAAVALALTGIAAAAAYFPARRATRIDPVRALRQD